MSVTPKYPNNRPIEAIRNASPDWLKTADTRPLLCYVHIPKAGGTSFNDALYNLYGRHFINYHSTLSKFDPRDCTKEMADDVRVIGGHNAYGMHRLFGNAFHRHFKRDAIFQGRDIRYVSIVRNPVARLHSYYRFVTTFNAHHHFQRTRHMSCAEFLHYMEDIEEMECTKSLQCWLIAGKNYSAAKAIRRVDEDYLMVGTVNRFDDFFEQLSLAMNWPSFEIVKRNVSPKTDSDQHERERELVQGFVDRYQSDDVELYRHVSSLWAQ